jgi:branched-chain amino acid transport system substrate-binding protein
MRARLALAVALVAVPAALAGGAADTPGVSQTTILIGGTVPLSGPESAYSVVAQGADAYFKYVNDHGGVFGRKIEYRYLDDGYDPALTVQQTRRLVEQDKVLAMFNQVGTEHVLATRAYLNQLKVPQLFAGSGARTLGREAKQNPWTLPYLPSFYAEGRIYGNHIAATRRGAKVAVLYEASDFGRDLLGGLKAGLGSRGKVVAAEGYAVTDANVASQIASLKASGATVLMIFALPKQTIQSFIESDKLGWRPRAYVAAVSIDPFVMNVARFNTKNRTTEGAVSTVFLKDASNLARWGKDAGVKLYYAILKKYAPGSDPKAVANIYGMAVAHTLVTALKKAGRSPTRESLMRAATTLNERDNPFLLPGIVARTGPGDRFPLEQVQMYRYTKGVWQVFGPLVAARGI